MNLLDKVKNEPPHFATDILEPLTDKLMSNAKMFAKSHYWNSSDSVNVQNVCGTLHVDYSGKSWLHLLQNGKRMNINLRLLSENPNYYFETETKVNPEMYYFQIDNKIYVSSDGNHRTCLAKFLLYYEGKSVLHGVNINKYTVDSSFKIATESLSEIIEQYHLPINKEITKTIVKRDDTAGWCCDYFDLKLEVENYRNGYKAQLSTEDIMKLIAESEKPFKTIYGKNKLFWRKHI